MSRWVMVDDGDPSIIYSPAANWFAENGTLDNSGNNGPPYLSTVHGTNTDGNFSYNFQGSAFILTGAIQVERASSVNMTTWSCIIDGQSTPAQDNPSEVDNRSRFCEQYDLLDGLHTLQVDAHGSISQTFWFDNLQYIPSASVSLANAAVYIDTSDPMWNFGLGWIRDSVGYATNQTGAKVALSLMARRISLQWYGYYSTTYSFAATNATYSIDGTTPISFPLNGILSQSTDILQNYQLFFTTDTFSAGSHQIEVIYNGDPNFTPLSIQSVVIQNGTTLLSSSTASVGSSMTNGSAPSVIADASKSNNRGALIAESVVIGVVTVLLVAGLFFWMFKRRKYRAIAEGRRESPEHSTYSRTRPVPFRSLPSSSQSPSARKRAEPQRSATRVEGPRFVRDADIGLPPVEHRGDAALLDVLPPTYSEI